MIVWKRRRNWIKRAMKAVDYGSSKYWLLNIMQIHIKILVNVMYDWVLI